VKPNIFIVGGGITGISCAYKIAKEFNYDVKLFEVESEFGGLSRNFVSGGWNFEYGPHNIHTQNEQVIVFLKELLGDDLKERKVNTLLFFRGNKVSYPLKGFDILTSLRPWEMILTGWDFLVTRINDFINNIEVTQYFDEWIIRRFGKKLYNIYFAPYVKKVWKIDPHELSSYVGISRIPVLGLRKIILNQIGLIFKKKLHPEETAFQKSYLPLHGAGRIIDCLKKEAEKYNVSFFANSEVNKFVIKGGKVVELQVEHVRGINKEIMTFPVNSQDMVISTMPINKLIESISSKPHNIDIISKRLDFTSLVLFYFKVKKDFVFNRSWVYFSDEKTIFNRITEHTFDHCRMVPEGYVSLCVEIPCIIDDEIWNKSEQELFLIILEQINNYESLPKDSIVGFFKKQVKYAYPRFRVNFYDHILTIFEYLKSIENLISLGRQGLFCYANIDQCIQMSFDLCNIINNDPTKIQAIYKVIWENSYPQ